MATPAEKAALTRKRRKAGAKAALTRARRTAAQKAAVTRKRRAAGRKAAVTRKRRVAARKSCSNASGKEVITGRNRLSSKSSFERRRLYSAAQHGR